MTGFCACGCGGNTSIATQTRRVGGHIKGQPVRFLVGHAARIAPHREQSPGWRGGRHIEQRGYVNLYAPDHPRSSPAGYVREHILVVERAMGKLLRQGAPVHHVNGMRGDNRNQNLVACDSTAYHQLLHIRARARAACGDPNALRCTFCRAYDRPTQMTPLPRHSGAGYHRDCAATYQRVRRIVR